MSRELTDNQRTFLEVLFEEGIDGDFAKAKVAAGYSPNYATSSLVKSLEEEILKATRTYLTRTAPRAALAIGNIIDNPTTLGVKEKMAAAKDILDRVGVVKVERMEITGTNVFILPSKKTEEEDDDG